ncbi:MAG: fused response regulator/phosphatase [Verrucomicrobia bacterium]|jgi:serine phosphatase RsbU (regulator of sigma subunit)|nr:fused response regulator/phosphatase [Verrucomicrobiota bacterium]
MKPSAIQVLLVDDDPVFTRLASELLKSVDAGRPLKLTTAADGRAALASIGESHYDVALLDHNLPGANGLEILAEIQKRPCASQPAVIMLTASGSESLAVEAMKRGAKDYLTKAGLDLYSLSRAIQSALTQKRLAEQVEAYHAQLAADLDVARRLQQSLLPQSYPVFPRSVLPGQSALRFEHRFFWTTQLGGDFFSVQALSDTQAGVLICDVMGHGVRSALVTTMLRALVGDLTAESGRPDQFLSAMNERLTAIIQQTGETLFATALYLVADVGAGRLTYARAGHPPPLHLRRRANAVAPLAFPQQAGPALGLFRNADYVACECELAVEDSLLLFTDGLFEVVRSDGNEFGLERLIEVARHRMHLPLTQLVEGVIEDVRCFCGGEEFLDDVCLLGVEVVRTGAQAAHAN